jgi:hypothetical protein
MVIIIEIKTKLKVGVKVIVQHYSMVKLPRAEPGDKRKHNNVD